MLKLFIRRGEKLGTYGSIIRKIGSRYALRFLERQADADMILQELESSNVIELVEDAVRNWPNLGFSGIGVAKGTLLYVVCRALKPRAVVETGVASGVSTLFMLQALDNNSFGTLYSIDLPNVEEGSRIPEGLRPGWIVPGYLKSRWVFRLGNAMTELPKVLEELGEVDVFLHDSLHTYEHMMWEYRTAWPHIARGGVLVSDDVLANRAFTDFMSRVRARSTMVASLGIARKPWNGIQDCACEKAPDVPRF